MFLVIKQPAIGFELKPKCLGEHKQLKSALEDLKSEALEIITEENYNEVLAGVDNEYDKWWNKHILNIMNYIDNHHEVGLGLTKLYICKDDFDWKHQPKLRNYENIFFKLSEVKNVVWR